MPLYRIHITSSDGAIDSRDPEGDTLAGIDEVRAVVVETLLECANQRVPAGSVRNVRVTACDEHGGVVYGDEVDVLGPTLPSAETAGVWRAMAAMNALQGDPQLG